MNSPDSLRAGLAVHRRALGVLWRERSLWPLAILPALLAAIALFGTAGVLVSLRWEIFDWATAWAPLLEVAAWYQWIWVGPAKLLIGLVGTVLALVFAGVLLVAAYLASAVLAAPVADLLSRRVERLLTGRVEEVPISGWIAFFGTSVRAIYEEAKRVASFLTLQALIALAGMVVPGGQIVAAPALALLTIVFLPLEHTGYFFDRRGLRFRERRALARRQPRRTLGYGTPAFVLLLVPGVNALAMPVFVVAGTILGLNLVACQPSPRR